MDDPRLHEDVRLAWDRLAREVSAPGADELPNDSELDLTDRMLSDLAAGRRVAAHDQPDAVGNLLLAARARPAEDVDDTVGFATLVTNLYSDLPLAHAAEERRRGPAARRRLGLVGRALAAKAAVVTGMTVVGVAGAGAATGLLAVAVTQDRPPTTAPAPAEPLAPVGATIGDWSDDEPGENPTVRTSTQAALLHDAPRSAITESTPTTAALGSGAEHPPADAAEPDGEAGTDVTERPAGGNGHAGGNANGNGNGGNGNGGKPSPGSNGAAHGNGANAGGNQHPGGTGNGNGNGNGAANGNANGKGNGNGNSSNPGNGNGAANGHAGSGSNNGNGNGAAKGNANAKGNSAKGRAAAAPSVTDG